MLTGRRNGINIWKKNIMAKIVVDINVLLDDFLNRDEVSKDLIDKLVDSNNELFITASMAATLDYFLNKYRADKPEFKRKFFSKFKIITTSGFDALSALDFKDGEDALISLSFKRAAGDGIIITNDKDFPSNGLTVLSPDEALMHHDIFIDKSSETIPMLDLKKQYHYLMEDIDHAILKNIADTKYILGPQVKELEDKIAQYLGVKHCIGMSSGTEALVLSLRALAIKLKDKEYFERSDLIITTPFTFTATGDAILRAGATPVFIDIDPNTYNIDTNKIKEYLSDLQPSLDTSRVIGIIPVHLYGHSCQMDDIMEIAKEYNLFVVEDVAQAFGGMWKDKKLGSIGTTGCFSFFPSKNLGGFGDGGMVSTNDDEIAALARMLLKHGGKDKYNVDHIGYNARLDTLQAAIILAKFKHIDNFNERRRKIAETYNKELKGIDSIVLPVTHASGIHHVCHQYTIKVSEGRRDELQKYLMDKGISSMVYYPYPLHKMKVFDNGRSITFGSLENAEAASSNVLSLPIEPLQDEDTTKRIISAVKEFCGK